MRYRRLLLAPLLAGLLPALLGTIRPVAASPKPVAAPSQGGAIALDPSLGVTYLAQPFSNRVFVLSSKDAGLLGVLSVPPHPAGLAVDSRLHLLYVASDAAGVVTVFNERTRHVTRTLPIGGHPAGLSLADKGRTLLVTDSAAGTIRQLSLAANAAPPVTVFDAGSGADQSPMLIPSSGSVGTHVMAWGRGFAPREPVQVYWGLAPLVRVQSDQFGMVMASFRVPRHARLGRQLIVFIGQRTTRSGSALLTVVSPPPPPRKAPIKKPAPKPILQRLLGPKLVLAIPTPMAIGPLKKLGSGKGGITIPAFALEAGVALVGLGLILRMRRRRRKKAAARGSTRGPGSPGPPRALKGAA